ncbi:GGDEF domain-containing protein [Hahella aquimaris]|uniref:GGDEF domain-containing protein n=1 Tax=Hahella sp. HNIBRBA332 TaxID=3015983 RepID=UPI00273C211A|nr:GGDEF domain-containing protein [Hahella sp. HNIBRBA332]WLQ12442.1 GGDEF domain-containing protein [Hahella sp. HNIBRBA332]
MTERNRKTNFHLLSAVLDEEAKVVSVIKALAYAASFMSFVIGVKSWLWSHTAHASALFLFCALMLMNVISYNRTLNQQLFKTLFLWLVGLLFLYLIAGGGESNTGILWFYVFPPFVFYVAGLRTGSWMLIIMVALIAIIFRFPELPWVRTVYNLDFQLRFAATVSFVSVFAFVMDHSRRKARQELINMARLYEKAARTDELTQLPNRRDMQQQLEKEYFRYKRHGSHFSVILLDIDHFKMINDTYGHDAGDFVLMKISELLVNACRKMDMAARWGGEEFLIQLPDTSLVQALTLAERLRKSIETSPLQYKNQEISYTISCGVCSISQAKDLASLLKQADVNLYQAKIKGRNMVIPLVVQKASEDEPV